MGYKPVVIDGIIYSYQKTGGISRIFTEIMPRICEYDNNITIKVVLNKKIIQSLPAHKYISYLNLYRLDSFFRPSRIWKSSLDKVKRNLCSLAIGDSKNMVWHSTYYTLPSFDWKGSTVVTVYDLIYEHFKTTHYYSANDQLFLEQKQNTISMADMIISISNTTKEDLNKYYGIPEEKVKVIYPSFSPIFQKKEHYTNDGKPFILYVGSRNKHKNFDGLLQAFSKWARNSEVDLIAVGEKWFEGETRRIELLDIGGKVKLIERPNDHALSNLYNRALCFVYPSLYEGFGIPVLEAMACGCPVIASKIPSTVEIAGEVPFYHEPGIIDQMVENLEQVYCGVDVEKRSSLGLNHVKAYTWEKTARQTADLYQDLLL